MPVELIWDKKYIDGKKCAPLRIPLPFQTVETVNESVQERQRSLDSLFNGGAETIAQCCERQALRRTEPRQIRRSSLAVG